MGEQAPRTTGLAKPLFHFAPRLFLTLGNEFVGEYPISGNELAQALLNATDPCLLRLDTQNAVLKRHDDAIAEFQAHGFADHRGYDDAAVLIDASLDALYFH